MVKLWGVEVVEKQKQNPGVTLKRTDNTGVEVLFGLVEGIFILEYMTYIDFCVNS